MKDLPINKINCDEKLTTKDLEKSVRFEDDIKINSNKTVDVDKLRPK